MNLERYAPGGDIYLTVEQRWGALAANRVYQASLVNDGGVTVRNVLSNLHSGSVDPGSTSTAQIFWQQIATDPLAAPLAGLNTQLGNAVLSVFKNPFVMLALGALVFYWLGGFRWLQRSVFK